MAQNFVQIVKGLNIQPVTGSTVSVEGDVAENLTAHTLEFHNGTAVQTIVTAASGTIAGSYTFSTAPTLSSLSINEAVFTNGSKVLVSNAITGSGSVVMNNSPTIVSPTITSGFTVDGFTSTGEGLFTGTENQITISPSTTTHGAIFAATNTGSGLFFGVDNSTGSNFHVGDYAPVIDSQSSLTIITNGTSALDIDSSGNCTIVNPLSLSNGIINGATIRGGATIIDGGPFPTGTGVTAGTSTLINIGNSTSTTIPSSSTSSGDTAIYNITGNNATGILMVGSGTNSAIFWIAAGTLTKIAGASIYTTSANTNSSINVTYSGVTGISVQNWSGSSKNIEFALIQFN